MDVEPNEAGTSDEIPSPPAGREARARAKEAVDKAQAAGKSAGRELADFVDEHPIAALATAVGAGYLVGGGLFTPLTGRLVGFGWRLGLRLAVLPLLEQQVASMLSPDETDGG